MKTQTQFLEIKVDVPLGWQAVRYDFPKKGEYYLDENNLAKRWVFAWPAGRRVIILTEEF